MKLSVIIVSYNVRFFLEQCIVSVQRAAAGIDHEIYVVDNDSHDGTVEYISARFGDGIKLIESRRNLGFAKANNMAIRQSSGQYVLLLNPDTIVAEDSLRRVIDFMDAHPQAGGAGARMHNADGTLAPESRRALPTPYVSLLKMMGRSRRYYMSTLPWDQPAEIEVVSGAFFMLRRSVLDEIGLLDEDFFMYGEDIDLSYRVLKAGHQNWYVPADIIHYKGESTQKSSFRYVHVFYQAMLIFFRKHYGHLSLMVTLPIKTAIYFRALMALVQTKYGVLRQSLGLVAGDGADTRYAFVGGPAMLDECRRLASRRGLTATFHDTTPALATADDVCVVYDTKRFGYGEIMSRAAAEPHVIGTYSTDTHVVITPMEIIR